MGVNATGTLGGRRSSAEDARIEAPYAARGVLGGAVPLPRKFINFSSQNGVIWCILGVFLRFMCPTDCSCIKNFIEVPVCSAEGKNKALVKILGVATPTTPAALTPMASSRRSHVALPPRVLDSKNYSSNVSVLQCSFNSTSGRKFQFPVPVFQLLEFYANLAPWGRPVRTKSRQNESLFRSNGTHVFVL